MEITSIVIYVVLSLAILLSSFVWWVNHRLSGMHFWMGNGFLFGKRISKLATSTAPSENGWSQGEDELCKAYNVFIPPGLTKEEFDEHRIFIRKANSHNCKRMPPWLRVVYVLLTLAEGLGFAFTLGAMQAGDLMSANMQFLSGIGVVIALTLISVLFMHHAGEQYYISALRNTCLDEMTTKADKSFEPITVTLDQKQSIDDGYPACVQRLNRSKDSKRVRGSYGTVWGAVVFVAIVMIVSVGVRYNLYKNSLTESTANPIAGAIFAERLPSDVMTPQIKSDEKAFAEGKQEDLMAHSFGFFMLAVVYVVTQFVGVLLSYHHAFPSNECLKAYDATLGYSTYRDYEEHYRPLRDLADSRLAQLQRVMDEKFPGQKISSGKKFREHRSETKPENYQSEQILTASLVTTPLATDTIVCPTCNKTSAAGTKFCGDCGSKIVEQKLFCTGCGKELKPGTKFCGDCGTKA